MGDDAALLAISAPTARVTHDGKGDGDGGDDERERHLEDLREGDVTEATCVCGAK